MTNIKEIWQSYKDKRARMSIGMTIRNKIHSFALIIHPYAIILFPNFRVVHYFYIISITIIGSILIYPVKNARYIDILYTTAGCATQAGLNTINYNETTLYQQIIMYILTTLATPIFIHGSLLFVRLYWFERHFDDIKESSKLNFKMRRNATLAARTQSFDSTRYNTNKNQGIGFNPNYFDNTDNNPLSKNENVIDSNSSNTPSLKNLTNTQNSSPQSSSTIPNNNNNTVIHISEPSDEEQNTNKGASHDLENLASLNSDVDPKSVHNEGIKFGNLPHPNASKVPRKKEIDPSDMFMSIAMLRNHRNQTPPLTRTPSGNIQNSEVLSNHNTDNDDDGEVLIIKPPNEIENDIHNPIYTKKAPPQQRIQFDVHEKPHRRKKNRPVRRTSSGRLSGKKKWSKLRKSFLNTGSHHSGHKRSYSMNSIGDENASIDSENDLETDNLTTDNNDDDDDDDDEGADADDENAIDDEDDTDDNNTTLNIDNTIDMDDEEDENQVQRAQSNLALPSKDETGGKKYSKRSNTLEVTPGRRHSFMKSPTFDKMIGRKNRTSKKKSLKRIKTPSTHKFTTARSDVNSTNNSEDNYDSSYDEDTSTDDEEIDAYSGDQSLRKVMSTNYLSWVPTVGRNSTFVHLSEDQKEELGGVEYRAVKLLIKILLAYYIGFHIISAVGLTIWINCMPSYAKIVRDAGVSPTWWGFFEGQSAFNDLGFTLTPDSMQSFQQALYVMIWVAFFVVIGNTGFPVFLRFLIWLMFKFAKPLSLFKESLGFLLDHPRRCFTLLFPSIPTWWLFMILIVLNGVDLILFVILDFKNSYLEHIPVGYRIMDGLFQAFSTRTAGFAVVDLSQLHPAVQVSYMLMMYISVLPLAISIRRTNVYEEQSLGLYLKEQNEENDTDKSPKTFIGTHLRNQLSFDLWFIFLGLFIICIAEGGKLDEDNPRFSVFSILFEIISAYGTVGLSLGYPNVDQSLSYKFTTISKLVIIAMMIRGRHRGLPYSLDRAIMLPNDDMHRRDQVQENHAIRRNATIERSATNATESSANNLRRAISRRASVIPGLDSVLGRRRPSSTTFHTGNRFGSESAADSKPITPDYHSVSPSDFENQMDEMIELENRSSTRNSNHPHHTTHRRNSQFSHPHSRQRESV